MFHSPRSDLQSKKHILLMRRLDTKKMQSIIAGTAQTLVFVDEVLYIIH